MGHVLNPPGPILLTTDAVGGVWTWALDLAQGLADRGAQVVLAVLGPSPDAAQQEAAGRIEGLDLRDTGLPLDWTARDASEIADASHALAGLAREASAALAHVHSPALAAESSFPCPVVASVHSCLATWWGAVKGSSPLPEDFRWRVAQVGAGLRRADVTTAPSLAFALAVGRAYGTPPPVVVHNGRAREPMAPKPAREYCAFTAGRLWDEGKNVAAIDRAAARLDSPVYAAGPLTGPNGAQVAFSALRTLGTLDAAAVSARLQRSPVYVSSARYEPFGLSVLEAAMSGAALVLSDIPVFRELWSGAAMFTDPDDDLDIAASIDTLLNDEPLRAQLAAAARRRAQRFGVETMISRMLEVYGSIAPFRDDAA